jgi:hypothetical protein
MKIEHDPERGSLVWYGAAPDWCPLRSGPVVVSAPRAASSSAPTFASVAAAMPGSDGGWVLEAEPRHETVATEIAAADPRIVAVYLDGHSAGWRVRRL